MLLLCLRMPFRCLARTASNARRHPLDNYYSLADGADTLKRGAGGENEGKNEPQLVLVPYIVLNF